PPPTPLDTQELFECLKNLLPKDNVEIPVSLTIFYLLSYYLTFCRFSNILHHTNITVFN
ncbi:9186_t:CDS:1, partial [Entrophospora sp. SA101]